MCGRPDTVKLWIGKRIGEGFLNGHNPSHSGSQSEKKTVNKDNKDTGTNKQIIDFNKIAFAFFEGLAKRNKRYLEVPSTPSFEVYISKKISRKSF